MPVTKVLARSTSFEIEAGETPAFVPIGGINNFSVSDSKNDADTTDFDDEGAETHLPTARGREWTISGHRLEDIANGDRDPGQEAVEELGTKIGPEGLGKFRVTSPGGAVRVFTASANVTPYGGGNNDPSSWQAVLTQSGPLTEE